MWVVQAISYSVIAFMILWYGQFFIIVPNGPYGVGKREKIIKKDGYSLNVSIFYPIEREVMLRDMYDKTKTSVKYAPGFTGLDIIAKLFQYPFQYLAYQIMVFRLHAINDAKLHPDFEDGFKKLTPVIGSHGLLGHRYALCAHVQEMASYGCIVYTCDHTDRS